MERRAGELISRIDAMGGMLEAIERGFPQAEIARSSYEYQRLVESGRQKVVGVNAFTVENERPPELLEIGEAAAQAQCAKLQRLRARRDNDAVARALDRLRDACRGGINTIGGTNTMPAILDAVRAEASLGEICGAMSQVFGVWREPAAV
jgi:methylmalonyl-CoA mutase N-terminal domain/subunit